MVSQALLGTPVHVLQISTNGNPWPQVQTPDQYTGWVHYAGITRMSFEEYHAWNAAPKVVVTALNGMVYEKASSRSATVSDVVAGDRLKYLGRKGSFLKVASSWKEAKSSLNVPVNFLIALICAAPPTLDTLKPGLTAGRIPLWNLFVSR